MSIPMTCEAYTRVLWYQLRRLDSLESMQTHGQSDSVKHKSHANFVARVSTLIRGNEAGNAVCAATRATAKGIGDELRGACETRI